MGSSGSKFSFTKKFHIVLLISFLSVLIIFVGYFYYNNEVETIRRQKRNELKAIAQLKISQIGEWYKDELGDAERISKNTLLIKAIDIFFASRNAEDSLYLNSVLADIKAEHHYTGILLTSPEGEFLISPELQDNIIDSLIKSKIDLAVKTNSTTTSGLYKSSSNNNKINFGFVKSVLNEKREPLAVVIYFVNINKYLYPIIEKWPVQSETSETFLFRKEGDHVLFLNELRYKHNTALTFKLPMTRKDLPAVQGALGYKGIFEGNDYRNVKVFAYVNSIPGTPWFMVAKVDKSELFEELHSDLLIIIIITILFVLITGTSLSFLYSYRQRNFYKELYKKEKELWQSQEKFKVTIDSLGDGVIIADINGKVQYMNKMAVKLTGLDLREAKGRKLSDVYTVKNEKTGQRENNIVQKVFKQGIVKELANHTLLISSSGKEIPVIDTGAPIFDNDNSIIGLVLTFQDETEKRHTRKLIEKSEIRLRSTLDNMMEGCQIISDDWRYIYVNNAAAKHGRTTKEKLIGKTMMEAYPGIEDSELFTVLEECKKNFRSKTMLNEFTYPDGKKGWFELSIEPVPEGIFILSIDVTEKKHSEKALKNSEKKYRELVENIDDIIFSVDIKGMVEYLSPGIKKVLGYEPDELIGKHISVFIKDERLKAASEAIENFKEGSREPVVLPLITKKGDIRQVRFSQSPIMKNDKLIGIRGVATDITEKINALKEMTLAKEQVEELNRVKTHFFANMSHELRTPFVGIMGYAELLADSLKDPEEKEMAEGILNTSKRMKETLSKILNLTKFELSGVELDKKEIEMSELINSVHKEFVMGAEQKNLAFNIKIIPESLVIKTDETLLKEILNNIVSNAIIYTNEGKIEIAAEKQNIKDEDKLIIKVADTGIGIAKEKQEIVWEEFRQVSEGLTRSYQGTGLGLSIVKKYTELLEGKISLESEENVGSTFILELPLYI